MFSHIIPVTSIIWENNISARVSPKKKLIAVKSAEAHCNFRVGTTSDYLAKLPHLLEEPSHLPAELQNLVSEPDLALRYFLGGYPRRNVVFSYNSCYIYYMRKQHFRAGIPQKKLIAVKSAEAHCTFRVGTTSDYLAKLPHLLEEPSHLPAELQNLLSEPELSNPHLFVGLFDKFRLVLIGF